MTTIVPLSGGGLKVTVPGLAQRSRELRTSVGQIEQLTDINDVDALALVDGAVPVYNSSIAKYEVQQLTINDLSGGFADFTVDGGSF